MEERTVDRIDRGTLVGIRGLDFGRTDDTRTRGQFQVQRPGTVCHGASKRPSSQFPLMFRVERSAVLGPGNLTASIVLDLGLAIILGGAGAAEGPPHLFSECHRGLNVTAVRLTAADDSQAGSKRRGGIRSTRGGSRASSETFVSSFGGQTGRRRGEGGGGGEGGSREGEEVNCRKRERRGDKAEERRYGCSRAGVADRNSSPRQTRRSRGETQRRTRRHASFVSPPEIKI